MNKKVITILAVVVIAIVLLTAYKTFLSPKGEEGSKEVTIHIVNKNENIDETFTYKTDHEYLLQLLEEKQEELGVTLEETEYGPMVTGMANYVVDPAKQEFFLISINGEDAMTGVAEIPLKDKDVYKFELTNY
ncbi:MAG: DUF4430 domain-containing protein [Tissierellia bacterium]|nr:DUF4430 domain-containing protein [Tissierellia bacterium]